MPERLEPSIKLVAFWPLASGGGVESIAVRFAPSLSQPFAIRLTSHTEPRLAELAGFAGFALRCEFDGDGEFDPRSVSMQHLRPATQTHAGAARRR